MTISTHCQQIRLQRYTGSAGMSRYIVTVSELQLQAIFLVHRERVLINQLQPNSLFLDDGF